MNDREESSASRDGSRDADASDVSSPRRRTFLASMGAAAWMMNPFLISFLSNGQYENHVGWAFPMVLLGMLSGGVRGSVVIALGIIGAAFSSPYQAIPVALVIVAAMPFNHRHRLGVWAALVVAFVACYTYFTGPQPMPGGECGPTSGTMPAVLSEVVGGMAGIHLPPAPDRATAATPHEPHDEP